MTTDEKRWKRLNELLAEALQEPADQRETWVAENCRDEPELEADLLELLQYDAEQTGGLASSIATAKARAADSAIGTSVGHYRITDKIAEGGMGVVYAGQRDGADFDQRVAIKVLHSHLHDPVAQARFVAERRILATLNHANIARLVDGGMTEAGLPYIVMEYIEGENIADYCSRNKLDNASIIRLIIDVCGALQYAHNQLVIHRDIKPSNILVDASGAPRLLDFGIAKLLEQDGSDGELTRADRRALTPLYASPEQLGSRPVSTAADVYGVGLLLYRLLTGRLPYTPTSDHPRDIEAAILSMPAETPSSAVTRADNTAPEKWLLRQKKALRGDLDTILLMALRKEPERRYATVDALAEDLERYLEQLPIRARGDTFGYRAHKFIARHRLPVALTSLLVVSAVGLTAFYTARIETEREVAQQTADFLTGLFVDSDHYQRSQEGLTVAELVSTGADKVASDTSLDPLVRARLLGTITQVLTNVGQLERAEALIVEALSIYERIESPVDHVNALRTLSKLRLAQGRYADGLAALDQARGMAVKTTGTQSLTVARIACQAAYLYYRNGDYDAMYENTTFALERYQALLPEDDYEFRCPYSSLATYHQVVGEPRKAIEYEERVLELVSARLGPDDIRLASAMQNIGITLTDLGDYREAIDYYRRAVEILRRVSDGSDWQLPLYMYPLAHTLGKLGHYEEAHRLFNELVALQIEQTGEVHDTVAYWLNGHGDMLANLGATALADQAFQRAQDIYARIDKPAGHFDRSVTLVGLGKVARDRGDLEGAESLMQQALTIREDQIGKDHAFTQLAHIDLADVILRQGRPADARAAFEEALDILRTNDAGEHPTAAQALTGLGQVALAEGTAADAIEFLEQAIAMTETSIGRDHLDNVNRRLLLADAFEQGGDPHRATSIRGPANAARDRITADWNEALTTSGTGL
ncbi:MAG: tetratricopeptide repeat protein [Gammaproteobacteria bacterium]|nr:tetratricopeptide repeat protein [Gammaproteobacteria bacterium]